MVQNMIDGIVEAIMPGKKAADLFDITLQWDEQYIERLVDEALDEAYSDESIPEDERESCSSTDYQNYPAVKAFVDKYIDEALEEAEQYDDPYFDESRECATKYIDIKTKEGDPVPLWLYSVFEGVEIYC